jgi:hypothetical protein
MNLTYRGQLNPRGVPDKEALRRPNKSKSFEGTLAASSQCASSSDLLRRSPVRRPLDHDVVVNNHGFPLQSSSPLRLRFRCQSSCFQRKQRSSPRQSLANEPESLRAVISEGVSYEFGAAYTVMELRRTGGI